MPYGNCFVRILVWDRTWQRYHSGFNFSGNSYLFSRCVQEWFIEKVDYHPGSFSGSRTAGLSLFAYPRNAFSTNKLGKSFQFGRVLLAGFRKTIPEIIIQFDG